MWAANLASSLNVVNNSLAETLNLLHNISSSIGSGLKSFGDFNKAKDSNDTAGQLSAGLGVAGAVVGLATTIANQFKAAKASRIEA